MNDILIPSIQFMCSQPSNIQDLAAFSSHSSSYGSEAEPDSSSRQDYSAHPPPALPSEMGLRYMSLATTDDSRFSPDSGTSHNSLYSIEPQTPSSTSTLTFYPTNVYQQPSLNGSTFSSGQPYFSPSPSVFSMPDIKPRLNSIHSSGMAPPSRSPNAQAHPGSPISARDLYTSATPHLRRTSDLISRSPPTSGTRASPLSPSSSNGFTSPVSMENAGGASPPLLTQEVFQTLQSSEGQAIRPEIMGRIDKGFFMAEGDWTCYRRNYFSLNCSFALHPAVPTSNIHIIHQNGSSVQVYAFAMCIAAVVDGRDGKPIELVQHTPKRDKGPQEKPKRVILVPRTPVSHGMYGESGIGSSSRAIYDQPFGQNQNQPGQEATFERIQFKNATANNGKRRAAQQYYHLVIELFADVGQQGPERFIKVASRISAPMVVRGRSPGHYQSERRGSNGSAGAGGSSAGGAGSYTPGSSSRAGAGISMSGTSSMLQNPSYGSSYDHRSHHHRHHHQYRTPSHIPIEPVMSAEDAKGIEEPNCYLYYPAPIWEGTGSEGSKYHLPSLPEYAPPSKIKQEYGGHHHGSGNGSSFVLPSLASSTQDALGGSRHCERWEGQPESKGYFPTALLQQEMNMT